MEFNYMISDFFNKVYEEFLLSSFVNFSKSRNMTKEAVYLIRILYLVKL
jgi:hypothetical protein